MRVEDRVKLILNELGVDEVKLLFIDYPPVIASIPLLKAIVVSRKLADELSDSSLKAVLAHELYHLTMVSDRSRLARNVLHRLVSYSLLTMLTILMISPIIYWVYTDEAVINGWGPLADALITAGLTAAFIAAMPAASLIARRVEGRLIRHARLGLEEVEANRYAASLVGAEEFAKAVAEYSMAVRASLSRSGIIGSLFKALLNVTEAVDPHPRPEEVGGN